MTNETLPDGQRSGLEESLQILEAYKEMTKLMLELIRKPAVNTTYNYKVYNAPVYQYHYHSDDASAESTEEPEEEPPTAYEMVEACVQTRNECLWWGDASWSIVYRVYCIKGFKGTVTNFVDEVMKWPMPKNFPYNCNKDSVRKPLQRVKITGPIENWSSEGAQSREIKLGERLLEILNKAS